MVVLNKDFTQSIGENITYNLKPFVWEIKRGAQTTKGVVRDPSYFKGRENTWIKLCNAKYHLGVILFTYSFLHIFIRSVSIFLETSAIKPVIRSKLVIRYYN